MIHVLYEPRQAFQSAFLELLQEKRYPKITVTDVANRAGFARHTFYNHYETLDDLLSNLMDSVLDEFFTRMDKWDFDQNVPEDELRTITSFFQVWKDNPEIVRILNHLEIDELLVKSLQAYFTEFYFDQVAEQMPGASFALAKYMISFNAYSLLGILKSWLQEDMKHPPEVMAGFLLQLAGPVQRRQAVEKYKRIIQ